MGIKKIELTQLIIANELAQAGSELNKEDALDILERTKDTVLKEAYTSAREEFLLLWNLLKETDSERYQLITNQ
ncbi:TPA: hypothetical protein TT574_001095 [Streptococcus equi subsp. zooepidemicus]|nr:hypothetical protein JavanS193_0020 [Streptococcus satellite phage Javan193]QBX07843.1 hypothetical protein JavanS194_0020 [Streptococcus satellite phage Javan194]QBX07862.1 hypothetical protein JavanS195_0018 [Streptococcus satellite phage Javan195]HEK9955258.1 hypothetical protein [Streptococcus equi subsp. zooepidemicus]HEK9993955.1 hypothetical protein [Streptococcus equi subsp. zooepidemicus]